MAEIVVTRLDREKRFKNIADLRQFVAELIETRGSMYDPMEQACIIRYTELNGADDRLREIARKLQHLEPRRAPKMATPFDTKLADSEASYAVREAERIAAFDARTELRRQATTETRAAFAKANSSRQYDRAGNLQTHWSRRVEEAERTYIEADEAACQARARVTALSIAASRWRADQEYVRTRVQLDYDKEEAE
jgi:hypothetical protein